MVASVATIKIIARVIKKYVTPEKRIELAWDLREITGNQSVRETLSLLADELIYKPTAD